MEVLQMFRRKAEKRMVELSLTRRGCCGERFLLFATSFFLPENRQRM